MKGMVRLYKILVGLTKNVLYGGSKRICQAKNPNVVLYLCGSFVKTVLLTSRITEIKIQNCLKTLRDTCLISVLKLYLESERNESKCKAMG